MPYYYHVSRGIEESRIVNDYVKGSVFFSKKDFDWNVTEKEVGLADEGGYREYELFIPSNHFTESLNPLTKGKILRVTKRNRKKILKYMNQFENNNQFRTQLKKDGFNGLDTLSLVRRCKTGKPGRNQELVIFDFTPYIKDLKLVDIVKTE